MARTNNIKRNIKYNKGYLQAHLYVMNNGEITTSDADSGNSKTKIHETLRKAMSYLRKLGYTKTSEYKAK